MEDQNYDRMADEAENIDNEWGKREYPEEVKTQSGTSNVVRFLDGSNSFRKYAQSWFLCDDDTIKGFIVENDSEGRSILSKILGDPDPGAYYRGGYLESRKGQFGKVNVHQAKDPELFKRLTEYWNPAYNGTGNCRPSVEYIYNVLHRNPQQDENGRTFVWCDESKHTKLMRLKKKAFTAIKMVRDNCGEFTNYDIVFSKSGQGKDTVFTAMKGDVGTQHNRVGETKPEEKEYERYDLDYVTRLASANYILNNLRKTIERIDQVMGTNWIAELEKQKAIEDAAYEERKQQYEAQQQQQSEIKPDPVPETVTPPTGTASGRVPSSAPNVANEPKSAVRGAPVQASTQELEECGHCHEMIPKGLAVCPKCKGALLSDCDTCHKPFSVFATKCPHCGQDYSVNPA